MYEDLASAVICQAVEDLVRPWPRAVDKTRRVKGAEIKASAREFLLEPNEDLAFWCAVGDLNMKAIVEKARLIVSGELVIPDEAFNVVLQKEKV